MIGYCDVSTKRIIEAILCQRLVRQRLWKVPQFGSRAPHRRAAPQGPGVVLRPQQGHRGRQQNLNPCYFVLIEMCGTPSSDQVCALNPSTANGLYATGCLDAVEESIVANAKIVGGIACGVILLMVRGRAVSKIPPKRVSKFLIL